MESSTVTLLADLSRRGIVLRVEDGRLRYTAPPDAFTPDLLALVKIHKAALIDLLQTGESFFPPSFAQRRFWTLQRLNPEESFYNAPTVFRLTGPLDADILRKSLNAIVRRHESLRTTLQEIDGSLMQVVAPSGEIQMTEAAANPAARDEWLRQNYQLPFDLTRKPGLRVLLLKTGEDEHFLQICMHNTLYDRTSMLVFLQELSLHYAGFVSGNPAVLPAPAQYSEYVQWQESLTNSGMEERQAYWRGWFAKGEPPQWSWKPSEPAPETPSFEARLTWQRWPVDWTRKLAEFSQSCGATPLICLIAALAATLPRYTGCSDVTIGTTYSSRHHWKFETLIGPTIDVPALRIDVTGNPDFAGLVTRVRTLVADALTFQDVPVERVLSRQPSPLFRTVLSYFPETPDASLQLPGIQAEFQQEILNSVSRPDLYVMVWHERTPAGDALRGCWMHKRDVFSAATAERMARDFRDLLDTLLSH